MGLPLIATNGSHYIEEEDWVGTRYLVGVKYGDKISTPRGYGKGFRFGFPNHEFYFKTTAEMKALFKDIPEGNWQIRTELLIPLLPPDLISRTFITELYPSEGFLTQDDYLKHLTFIGARKRYER